MPETGMEIDKSIDNSIAMCSDKIEHHRKENNKHFALLVGTLILFGVLHLFMLAVNQEKAKIVNQFSSDLSTVNSSIKSSVRTNESLYRDFLRLQETIRLKTNNLISEYYRGPKENEYEKLFIAEFTRTRDTVVENDARYLSALEKYKGLPEQAANSFASFPEALFYFIYAIFILVFGVLTSFYRFHLKEISKYEHFLFGFLRIRIAGNNSTDKFNGDVKIALTKDAFTIENRAIFKEKKIESPLPGHPSSDAFTFLFNKLMDKVDTVLKQQEEKKTEDEKKQGKG